MTDPRKKWDLLWQLSLTAMQVGREVERLHNQTTIENYQKAHTDWHRLLAKCLDELDAKGDQEDV